MSTLRGELVEALRPLSKAAFGHEMRLALAIAIGRSESVRFTQAELISWVHVRGFSGVERPLESLLRTGALSRVVDAGREVMYERKDSVLWAYAEELLAKHFAQPSADTLF